MAKDPRVDAYIKAAPDFAKPILEHFRAIVHAACPDVVETIKWSSPSFQYEGPMCGMESFKAYCRISFWKGALLDAEGTGMTAAGHVGILPNATTIKDLPTKATLTRLVKQAATLNVDGVQVRSRPRRPATEVVVPEFFISALMKNRKAAVAFEQFSPSHRREYVQWLTEAKREETRQKRLETAIAQIAEGKPQNWKYSK